MLCVPVSVPVSGAADDGREKVADKDKKDDKSGNGSSAQSTQKKQHGADGKVSLPSQRNRRWT